MQHMNFVVGVDIDNVINNYAEVAVDFYNKKYNDFLKIESILNYDLQSYLKPECLNIFEEFEQSGKLSDLKMTKDCVNALNKLNQLYSVVFVTASSLESIPEKVGWIKKYLPWMDSGQFVACQDKKNLSFLDVLIDDCLDNLSGPYESIIFSQPWNLIRDTDVFGEMLRTNNWNAILCECKWLYTSKRDRLGYAQFDE